MSIGKSCISRVFLEEIPKKAVKQEFRETFAAKNRNGRPDPVDLPFMSTTSDH
ncbi:hypothetical protein D3OALGA1CA_2812 [Olavius algarvensis associated proteobacterium Delta 3]|nr:hypothetical protein D3OALGA1CA_2812 [Olavius algarvensis associated proteobacterium Delta 3]